MIILVLCAVQCGCASVAGQDADPLLSYAELSAEITIVRTPADEPMANARGWDDDFLAAE